VIEMQASRTATGYRLLRIGMFRASPANRNM
jgi:hypothetical protein